MEGFASAEAVNTDDLEQLDLTRATASARLRVLGQELEQKGISDFEVVVEQDGYFVRGKVPPRSRKMFGGLFSFKASATEPDPYLKGGAWERRYSESELDRLEDEYRTRRTKIGMPDDYAVSQVLRVVGAYVDARNWVLTGVNRTYEMIVITYRDATGQLGTSEQRYAALYDFALRLHDGRNATS